MQVLIGFCATYNKQTCLTFHHRQLKLRSKHTVVATQPFFCSKTRRLQIRKQQLQLVSKRLYMYLGHWRFLFSAPIDAS